jgi:hypothetical protein
MFLYQRFTPKAMMTNTTEWNPNLIHHTSQPKANHSLISSSLFYTNILTETTTLLTNNEPAI